MKHRRSPWATSAVLSLILFACTLLVFPLLFAGTLITRSGGKTDQILCGAVITLILMITAGLTVYAKYASDFGFRHCAFTFVLLTIFCYLNPMNSFNINMLTYRWLPEELVESIKGRFTSSLCFAIPMALVSVLTLVISIFVMRLKERQR